MTFESLKVPVKTIKYITMKRKLVQYGCTLILAVMSSISSFAAVWPSYAIEELKSTESPLGYKITQFEGSLISSIPMFGSLVATLMTGYLADKMGRKKTQILSGLLYALSWALIATARSTTLLIIGRLIAGFGAGISVVVTIVYTSEITELAIRGGATACLTLMYNIGIIVSYLLGWFCSYEMVCYISLTAAVAQVLILSCFKETPPYLLMMGKEKEALVALKFYRGESETTEEILEELSYLKQIGPNRSSNNADAENAISPSEKKKSMKENKSIEESFESVNAWKLLWTVRHNRRAVINSIAFMIMSVSMGMVAVQTYAYKFFTMAAPGLSHNLCSVMFAIVLVLASLLSILCTDLLSRRALMMWTSAVSSVCLAVLGGVMRWPGAPAWVAMSAVVVFSIVFHLGAVNMSFVQLSESFGPQVNSAATAIVLSFMFAANFVLLFLFEPSVTYLGFDGTLFLFAILAAITTVMSFFFIRETRRTPLETIQKMYDSGYLYKKVSVTEK